MDWPGKTKAIAAYNEKITKILRPKIQDSVDFNSTKNLLIEGDNLEFLKITRESLLEKIKLIYIDPPYNTGGDFIYRDVYIKNSESYLKLAQQTSEDGNLLVANTESNGRFHSDWLSMIYPRLKLSRQLLRDDGVIFISIDDHEIHNLRKVCDEIFGAENFRNTFILRRYDKNINRQFIDNGLATFNIGFEYVVCYAKSSAFKFNPIYKAASDNRSSSGYWKGFWNNADRPTMRYELHGVTPHDGQWKWSKGKAFEASNNYRKYEESFSDTMTLEEYWEKTGKIKQFIRRSSDGKGKNLGVEHWIAPSDGVLRNTNLLDIFASKGTSETKNIFDFPKNPEAIRLFIEAGTSSQDTILDFFAGSGSTAQAVFELNASDGGNRNVLLVQIPEPIPERATAKEKGFNTIFQITKNRMKESGKSVLKDRHHPNWMRDVGFRVLKVDTSNMKDVYYTPEATNQQNLSSLADNIKHDRTDEDLLFQVLTDWGIDLSLSIRKETIQGKNVFFVDCNVLIACFESDINEELIKELANYKPERAVFRNGGFASDTAKINAEQIFKQLSPQTDIRAI